MGRRRAHRASWPGAVGLLKEQSPARRTKFIFALAGVAVAIAVIVFFAAGAAAGRHNAATSGPSRSATTTSHPTGRNSTPSAPLTAVSPAIGLRSSASSPVAAGYPAATAAVPNLSVAQLAGQRVIYSYRGLEPPAALLRLISHGEAAGVIFFAGNVGSIAHLSHVVAELNNANRSSSNPLRNYPLLLMTDQEGGVVRRVPGPPALSEKQVGLSSHPQAAATAAGTGAASTLRSAGLNVNLAPVLDVYRHAGNFIDEFGRSFSMNPVTVATLGKLYLTAEQQHGVAATVKHFPGLGAAARNQNTDMGPVTLNLPLSAIRGTDELPYQSAIAANVKLVMVSWAIYPALDSRFPAGLSKKIVQSELRGLLRFGGVTITDALGAGALNPFGSIGHRATIASRAGMDLLLCAGQRLAEGQTALSALEADYAHDSSSAQAYFKAAAERVIALRAVVSNG